MKYALSLSLLMSALVCVQANASWQCTYTCGSKDFQEPKVGQGRSQEEARRDAYNQTCTQYVGGNPQFFRGCQEISDGNNDGDNNGNNGGWNNGGNNDNNGGWNNRPQREQWTCTYTCGSKDFQEPKVGRGDSQGQAQRDAQSQQCTQYVGGYPQYFRGCERSN